MLGGMHIRRPVPGFMASQPPCIAVPARRTPQHRPHCPSLTTRAAMERFAHATHCAEVAWKLQLPGAVPSMADGHLGRLEAGMGGVVLHRCCCQKKSCICTCNFDVMQVEDFDSHSIPTIHLRWCAS